MCPLVFLMTPLSAWVIALLHILFVFIFSSSRVLETFEFLSEDPVSTVLDLLDFVSVPYHPIGLVPLPK